MPVRPTTGPLPVAGTRDDIEPGAEWLRTILAALHSCEGLAAILHTGFRESNWCDQEVGIALGTGVPCVPLRIDFNPYGFLGAVQAVPGTDLPVASVAESIVAILAADKRTAESITEAAVRRLAAANSWNQANMLARFLQNHPANVTRDHIQRLRAAQKANAEVGGAFDVEPMLAAVEGRLPPVPAPPPGYDEEPF